MVTFRHPSPIFINILVFAYLSIWRPAFCQVGLKTLPLTAARNHTNLGRFSKWAGGPTNLSINAPSVELELAAILHDLANGVLTEPTTTTTTSTTTRKPVIKVGSVRDPYDSVEIQPPSSIPVSPPWDDKLWKTHHLGKNGVKPVQHQYVESPVMEPADDYESVRDDDINIPKSEDSEISVIRSDYGVNEIPWLAVFGVLWEVHVYTTAGLFSLIVLLSLYCLTRIYLSTQLLPKGYYITVHLLVFLAAFFRCVFFFHDPYAVAKLLPNGLSSILYNTGTPCIITALAVLILALLRTARLIILPLNLQSPVVVAIISGALVAGSLTIDAFGGFINKQQLAPGLKGVIQALTAGWGAALCIGYIIVYIRIERAAKRQQNEVVRLTFSRLHIEGSTLPHRFPKSSLKFGARFTLIASISGLLLTTLQVYGLINAEMVVDLPPQQPWMWFIYQTCCRILEITMWSCICMASALPANINKNDRNKSSVDDGQLLTVFACKGCTSCSNLSSCCIYEKNAADDMYSTICQTNHVARNFAMHNEGKLIPQDTIACTGHPPKHISTTLLPPKARKALNKTSTLHSAGSDAQLLWNNHSNANSSNSSSRPSSLILTEGGVIKFRTHDPHNDIIRIVNYPKRDFDSKVEYHDSHKKILENFESCNNPGEDNYINSGALTPEEKRIIEKTFKTGKLSYLMGKDENNGVYTDVMQQNIPYGDDKISKEKYSPFHEPYKYNKCSNSFDTNLCNNGSENGFYQTPSLDSSVESSGHIYASIQQPLDNIHHNQYSRRFEVKENAQGKVLNNSNFSLQNSSHQRSTSFSNHSHLDIIPTDYLTDVSQDPIDSPSSDHHCGYTSPHGYMLHSDPFYQTRYGMSPVNSYRCYNAPISEQIEHYNSQISKSSNNIKQNFSDIHMYNKEVEDLCFDAASGCPKSPSQRKRYLRKTGSSNFEKVSYSPLQGEDDQYPHITEEKIRPCGHRPRKLKLSPLSNDSPLQFTSSSPTSNRQVPSNCESIGQEEFESKEINNEKLDHCLSLEDSEWLKQKLKLHEPNSFEVRSQTDFSPVKSHEFSSDGKDWTHLKPSKKAPLEPISQSSKPSNNHSEFTDNSDNANEKSMEVRWPIKCNEEVGV